MICASSCRSRALRLPSYLLKKYHFVLLSIFQVLAGQPREPRGGRIFARVQAQRRGKGPSGVVRQKCAEVDGRCTVHSRHGYLIWSLLQGVL